MPQTGSLLSEKMFSDMGRGIPAEHIFRREVWRVADKQTLRRDDDSFPRPGYAFGNGASAEPVDIGQFPFLNPPRVKIALESASVQPVKRLNRIICRLASSSPFQPRFKHAVQKGEIHAEIPRNTIFPADAIDTERFIHADMNRAKHLVQS